MNAWAAFGWGAFSSASLFIGQLLAGPLRRNYRATGQIMGFGAGTMLSAVAYELVPESSFSHSIAIGSCLAIGALTYFVADRIVASSGGGERQSIDPPDQGASTAGQGSGGEVGSGAAMFIGALLDGVPEALVLGIGLALGGGISVAFVAAVFVSNIPQGVAGTSALSAAGYTTGRITRMWSALTLACAVVATIGYLVASSEDVTGLYAQAFAAGAVLTMLANSMMPEAYEHGGKTVGLFTVLGFILAAALTIASG